MSEGRTSQGKALNSQERALVLSVVQYFEQEKLNHGSLINVNKTIQRVAGASDISVKTVVNNGEWQKEVLTGNQFHNTREKRKRKKPVTDTDNFDADAIRCHVHEYLTRRQVPTFPRLLQFLRQAYLFSGTKKSQVYNTRSLIVAKYLWINREQL